MSTITQETAIRRLAGLCAKSEHSRADATERLRKWGFDPAKIEEILHALQAGGFINEERFCRSFIHDKLRLNKWGRLKIARALALRKIPARVYLSCLSEIDEDQYLAILQKLIETKRRSVQGRNEKEKTLRLIRFVAGRGFEMKYIGQCLDMEE